MGACAAAASTKAVRSCRVGSGVGGRPAGSRVHRASGLRGPRSRAGGEVLVASFTVSVDNADGGEGSEPDAAMFLAATAWGRVRRRRRRRRGRVAWVRGSRAGGLRGAAFTELRGVGVVGAVLVGGEVVVAGCTVSVDKADGEGSVPDAAVRLAATAWGRAWPVWLLGLSGATARHFVAHAPTSHAVWGITKPYISRCLGNYETLHLMLCGESTVSRRW